MISVLCFESTQKMDGFISGLCQMPETWYSVSTLTVNCLISEGDVQTNTSAGVVRHLHIPDAKIEAVSQIVHDAGMERLVEIAKEQKNG
jgi:hypothetical protein